MRSMQLLREALDALAAEDLAGAPALTLAESLVKLRRAIDGLDAQWLRRLEAFDRSGGATAVGAASTGAWVRTACRLAPGQSRARVELARALPTLPDTTAALAAGDISVGHAHLVATAIADLAEAAGADTAAEAEPSLVDLARLVDATRLRRELVHVRHALAPDETAAAAERTYQRRTLSVSETFGGMVAVDGMLDAEGGATLLSALTALSAPTGPDDARTPRQRRADALVELARRQLDSGRLPTTGGERPHVTVLVGLSTLERRGRGCPAGATRPTGTRQPGSTAASSTRDVTIGSADGSLGPRAATLTGAAGAPHEGASPPGRYAAQTGPADTGLSRLPFGPRAAETGWAGPISGEAARRLACDAGISRVITDGASQPLDVGRRTRTVPAALRTALTVRDRGCAWPGCDRPPQWTDAHHVVSWIDGGPTSLDNLVLLCRVHHRTVHEGRWQLTRTAAGGWAARPPGPSPPRAA